MFDPRRRTEELDDEARSDDPGETSSVSSHSAWPCCTFSMRRGDVNTAGRAPVARVVLDPVRTVMLADWLLEAPLPRLKKRMMHGQTICLWCTAPVTPRRGGSPRKFCSTRCRHEFHSCARRWAEAAVDLGILTIDDIRSGDPAACTLLQRANSPAPEYPYPSRVVPRSSSRYSQEDFERLLAVTIAARRR
jgi:hypothetical protein